MERADEAGRAGLDARYVDLARQFEQAGLVVGHLDERLDRLEALLRMRPDVLVCPGPSLEGGGPVALVRRLRARCEGLVVVLLPAEVPAASETNREERPFMDLAEPPPPSGVTAAEVRSHARRELRQELGRLLVQCRGNIAEMARRMGKDRSTVRYHLKRQGMLDADCGDASQADPAAAVSSRSQPTAAPPG